MASSRKETNCLCQTSNTIRQRRLSSCFFPTKKLTQVAGKKLQECLASRTNCKQDCLQEVISGSLECFECTSDVI